MHRAGEGVKPISKPVLKPAVARLLVRQSQEPVFAIEAHFSRSFINRRPLVTTPDNRRALQDNVLKKFMFDKS